MAKKLRNKLSVTSKARTTNLRTVPQFALWTKERIEMEKYIVKQEEQGKRLDMYVSNQSSEITRTTAQRLIEQGNVLVNGKKQKVAYKILSGDVVTIEKVEPKAIELKAQWQSVKIV